MNKENRKVIVFDMDGTLCDSSHRVHHITNGKKNWDAWHSEVMNDTPNYDIVWMLERFHDDNAVIVICTARDEKYKYETIIWLKENSIPYHDMYMRANGDKRDDSEVKVDLLEKITLDYNRPWLWVDDRQRVVDAIRSKGIRVLQVDKGDF